MSNIKIVNTHVDGIRDSLIMAGYPMQSIVNEAPECDTRTIDDLLERGHRLGSAPVGSGHDKFLRGITVRFSACFPRYLWQQWDTYGHIDSVSSQSTMHCITKMPLGAMLPDTDPVIKQRFIEIVEQYKANPSYENFVLVKASTPEGLMLTRGCVTNYQSLKTVFSQRSTHKLEEWRDICQWIASLPYAVEMGVTA